MTLEGLMTVILRYFNEFRIFAANYATTVTVRPIVSAKKKNCSLKCSI